jgi:endogenous inhibitor of DNA gyrase (YacG/DUF329 family)
MTRYHDTVFCDNCGAEITWAPYLHAGKEFCCRDCAEGRLCRCGERMDWEDEREMRPAGSPGEAGPDIPYR